MQRAGQSGRARADDQYIRVEFFALWWHAVILANANFAHLASVRKLRLA